MNIEDAYKILELDSGASPEDVKKAFRKKAAQLHPDKNPGKPDAEEKFKTVNEAYRILTGNERPDQQNLNDMFRGAGGPGFSMHFNDFLHDFFGRGGQRNEACVYPIEVAKKIDFEKSVRGGPDEIEFKRQKPCTCARQKCTSCNGEGVVHDITRSLNFSQINTHECHACKGAGFTGSPCSKCGGTGYTLSNAKIKIQIPPTGDRPIILKLGNVGHELFSGQKGDVLVRIIPTTGKGNMKIVAGNIVSQHKTRLDVMLFGGDIDVETIDGTRTVHVPENSRAGQAIQIKGMGVKPSGSHLVELETDYPPLTGELKSAIEKAYENGKETKDTGNDRTTAADAAVGQP